MKITVGIPTVTVESTPGKDDGEISLGFTVSGISNTSTAETLFAGVNGFVGTSGLALMSFFLNLYNTVRKVK